MRVLVLQPEDFPGVGPWAREHWDLILDLGKSSQYSVEKWARQCGCPVLRADSFRGGVEDVRRVREIFSAGRGRLIDSEGIDWWDLTSLLVAQEVLTVLALRRLAEEISSTAELWTTRSGGPASLLAVVLQRSIRIFGDSGVSRSTALVMRYAGLARRFSASQIKEIFFDKYDSGYRWRARFATRHRACAKPVVLVPSAYGNVSRMAAAYARLLPEQRFLMVATRRSGRQFTPPANMEVRDLADYANGSPSEGELNSLLARWTQLRSDLDSSPELTALSRAGVLDPVAAWMRDGLSIRNAWQEVLEREPVSGVLCGDDSNRYTLLPVLLAARRKIPTVDFHHGAFDGRYLMKELPCDVYLAKNEMERDYLLRLCDLPPEKVVIASPSPRSRAGSESQPGPRTSAIYFSEPYEVVGMRAAEVYAELLPQLCRLARSNGRRVVVKLHPFESLTQRRRMVESILSPEDYKLVTLIDGPLTDELMSRAWFGITVESTTVMDCLQKGIPCFLCGWLPLWPFEYAHQYARFGVGEVLDRAEQVSEIPLRLEDFNHRHPAPAVETPGDPARAKITAATDPAMLQRWLTRGLTEHAS